MGPANRLEIAAFLGIIFARALDRIGRAQFSPPSKVARNLFGINRQYKARFHPYGWAAGTCELKSQYLPFGISESFQRKTTKKEERRSAWQNKEQ